MKKLFIVFLFAGISLVSCKKGNPEFIQRQQQAEIDEQVIQEFIKKENIVANRDTSGVYYSIIETGVINPFFTSSSLVTVGFTGKLMDGTLIAESNKFHPAYILGSVIKGWQYGITKIKKGGTVRLLIPSRQAYGPYDQPKIPANSVLDFTITVFDVTN
ncbi:MAG: FKBP-type peptidyl-prolyl cis-trans isomerase [Sphingobacteriaceae bacterium]